MAPPLNNTEERVKDHLHSMKGARMSEGATVSRKELLVDGSDRMFRIAIHTIMAITNDTDTLRVGYGELIGISGAQHELMMLISRVNDGVGIGVGEVARLMKKSSSFVVMETNQLQKKGLIEKTPSLEDRRRVVLRVSDLGMKQLAQLTDAQRQVNDLLFGQFDRDTFLNFIEQLNLLLNGSARAVEHLQMLVNEYKRQQAQAATRPLHTPRKRATRARST